MTDISEDSAMFGIIIGFPMEGPDFIEGFEAGIVWGQLWSEKNPIKVMARKSSLEGITRLAEHLDCKIESAPATDDILMITITKTRPAKPPHDFEVRVKGRGRI